jgi:hypothetical protein
MLGLFSKIFCGSHAGTRANFGAPSSSHVLWSRPTENWHAICGLLLRRFQAILLETMFAAFY